MHYKSAVRYLQAKDTEDIAGDWRNKLAKIFTSPFSEAYFLSGVMD